jgi:aspartate aminotransferase/aromatic-amino-acid transaminase
MLKMTNFVKDSVSQTPIVDTVFAIVNKAKEAKKTYGEDAVTDATIGSLYTEAGELAALDCVFDSLKNLDNKVLASYAAGFTGNPDFRQKVIDWVLDGNSRLYKEVIATPGGTGAVAMTIQECLDPGQTVVLPEIAWGSYNLMAQMNNLEVAKYSLFDDDRFNMDSFREVCTKTMEKQDKLVVVINDPCHNPTGYSMTREEWEEVIAFLNGCSKKCPVVLLNDIAYIDFAFGQKEAKKYFSVFDDISDNMAVVVAFSLSKSMTSYGMRCGAAILMAKNPEIVNQLKTVFEKDARATWSNVNNGAMAMFVDVLDNHLEDYDAERQKYVALLKERSEIFRNEADAAGLAYYPYREGFFVTLSMDNDLRDRYHEALMENNIFTVKVNKGIRVAICSMPVSKVKGLAGHMKEILDEVQGA